jgi:hypothetical protein
MQPKDGRGRKPPRGGLCRVEFYAGQKAGETPRALTWRGRTLAIDEVRGRRRVLDTASGLISDVFECVIRGGRRARISKPARGPCRVRFLD